MVYFNVGVLYLFMARAVDASGPMLFYIFIKNGCFEIYGA